MARTYLVRAAVSQAHRENLWRRIVLPLQLRPPRPPSLLARLADAFVRLLRQLLDAVSILSIRTAYREENVRISLYKIDFILITVVSCRSAMKRSSCAAADFSKASCFLMRFSTSSIVCPNSDDMRYGSCAISHASATAASRANWYTSRTATKTKNKNE